MTVLSATALCAAAEFMQEVVSTGRVKPRRLEELQEKLDISLWRFLNCLAGMQAVFAYGHHAVRANDFCNVDVREGVGYVAVETYNDDHDLLTLLEASFKAVGLKGKVLPNPLQPSGRYFSVVVPAKIVQRFIDAANQD